MSFQLLWRHHTPGFLAYVLLILLLLQESCAIWISWAILSAQELLITLWGIAVEFVSHLLLQSICHWLFHSLSVSVHMPRVCFNLLPIFDPLCLIFELRVTCWGSSTVSLGSGGAEGPSHGTVDFVWAGRGPNLRVSGRVDFVAIDNSLTVLGLNIGLLVQLHMLRLLVMLIIRFSWPCSVCCDIMFFVLFHLRLIASVLSPQYPDGSGTQLRYILLPFQKLIF